MPAVVPPSIDSKSGDQLVICINLAPTLQRLSDCLQSGYTHVAECQPVPHGKVRQLLEKWVTRYPILGRKKQAGTRAKQAGKPRYKVVVFWNRNQSHALMFLMTDRPELDEHRERWMAVAGQRGDRLRVYQYEAVRITKAGQDHLSWTWQIERDYYLRLQKLVQKLAHRGLRGRLESVEKMAQTWPGFHRVRRQHHALGQLMCSERSGIDPPKWRALRYVQRLKTRRSPAVVSVDKPISASQAQ